MLPSQWHVGSRASALPATAPALASTASQIGPRSNPLALVSRPRTGAQVAADDPETPELGPAARRRAAIDLEAIYPDACPRPRSHRQSHRGRRQKEEEGPEAAKSQETTTATAARLAAPEAEPALRAARRPRKRARTPTPPVGGILPNAEGRPPKRSAAAAMERTVLNRA